MKPLHLIAAAVIALSLAACGDKGGNASQGASAPVAAVPPPAGTTWSQTVAETPEHGYVMGNPAAGVKLIEFSSFTCPHCRDFNAESATEIRKMVDTGKLSFEVRRFVRDPLDLTMAMLSRCGGKDPFFAMTEQLFANQSAFVEKAQAMTQAQSQAISTAPPERRFVLLAEVTGLIDFVKQRGISEDQARQCLGDAKEADMLAKGVQDSTAKYNITGTPTFVINGAVVENTASWPPLKAKLAEAGI
jgi:protein-disulfide isomerase